MSLPTSRQIQALNRRERHSSIRITRNTARLIGFSNRCSIGVPDESSDNEASRGSVFSTGSDSDSGSSADNSEQPLARRITVDTYWDAQEGGMVEAREQLLLEFPDYSSDEEEWRPEVEEEEQPAVEAAEEQTVEAEGLSWMEGEDRTAEEQPMAEPEPSGQPILAPAVQPQPSQSPAPPRETYKGEHP